MDMTSECTDDVHCWYNGGNVIPLEIVSLKENRYSLGDTFRFGKHCRKGGLNIQFGLINFTIQVVKSDTNKSLEKMLHGTSFLLFFLHEVYF